jgi:hypothetical protein
MNHQGEEKSLEPVMDFVELISNNVKKATGSSSSSSTSSSDKDDDDSLHNEIARLSEAQEELSKELNGCELENSGSSSSSPSSSQKGRRFPTSILTITATAPAIKSTTETETETTTPRKQNQQQLTEENQKVSPLSVQSFDDSPPSSPISQSLLQLAQQTDPLIVTQARQRVMEAYQKLCCVTLFVVALFLQVQQFHRTTAQSTEKFWIKLLGMGILCGLASRRPQNVTTTTPSSDNRINNDNPILTRTTKLLIVYMFLWAKLVNFMFQYQVVIR